VALPHAEPEHVLSPALAIATLAGTVKFREMGSPATQLEVGIVVMPAFTAKDQASGGLAHLIERFQDPHLRTTILAAADAEALRAVVGPVFRGASQ
jgi:PTS system galactitol-specific IIA component